MVVKKYMMPQEGGCPRMSCGSHYSGMSDGIYRKYETSTPLLKSLA